MPRPVRWRRAPQPGRSKAAKQPKVRGSPEAKSRKADPRLPLPSCPGDDRVDGSLRHFQVLVGLHARDAHSASHLTIDDDGQPPFQGALQHVHAQEAVRPSLIIFS